jgi:hypothetical protein
MDEISHEKFLNLTWEDSEKLHHINPILYKYFTQLSKLRIVEAKSKKPFEFRVLSPSEIKFRIFRLLLEENIKIRGINNKYAILFPKPGKNKSNFFKDLISDYYNLRDLQIGKFNSENTDNIFDHQSRFSQEEINEIFEILRQPDIKLNKITFQFIKSDNTSHNLLIKSPITKKRLLKELMNWLSIQISTQARTGNGFKNPITKPKDYVSYISSYKKMIANRILYMLEGCTHIVAQEGKKYSNKQLIIIGKIFVLFEILDTEKKFRSNISTTNYSSYDQYLRQNLKDIIT